MNSNSMINSVDSICYLYSTPFFFSARPKKGDHHVLAMLLSTDIFIKMTILRLGVQQYSEIMCCTWAKL
jgi:hypothetical protein